jgi:alginate O-acetyltransferase complex protein AlgI
LYARWPTALQTAMTFTLILFTWVFFRAADLATALVYVRSLLAIAPVGPESVLLAGIMYQPYYLFTFLAAAVVTWAAPQTWDWTRSLPPWKAAAVAALFLASTTMLATQAYNPFIYFIF